MKGIFVVFLLLLDFARCFKNWPHANCTDLTLYINHDGAYASCIARINGNNSNQRANIVLPIDFGDQISFLNNDNHLSDNDCHVTSFSTLKHNQIINERGLQNALFKSLIGKPVSIVTSSKNKYKGIILKYTENGNICLFNGSKTTCIFEHISSITQKDADAFWKEIYVSNENAITVTTMSKSSQSQDMTQSRCVVNPMFSIKGVHWKPLHVLNLSKSLNTATYSLWGTIYTNISSNFYKTEDEIILPTENVQLGYPEHISSKSKIQETEMLFEHSPPSFTKQAVEARQFGHKHFYTPAGRTVTIPLKGSTQVLLLKSGNEGSYSLYGKERPQGSKLYTTSFSSFEDKMPESTVENQTSQNDSTTISFHDKCDQDEEVDQIRVKPILRLNLTSLKHGSKKAETAIAKPNVYIKIKNTLKNLLGKAPLPAGKFLIYHEQEGESLAPKLSKNTYVYNANLTHPVNIGDSFELKIDEAENVVCRWMHIPFSIRKVKTKDLPREIPLRTRLIEMGIDEVIQRDMFVKVSCRRNEGEEKTFLNISPLELMKEEDELKKLKGNLDTDSYQNGNKDNSSQRNSPISGFLSGPKILFNSAKNFLFRFMKSLSKQAKNSKPTFVNTLAKETIYEGENILFEKDTLLEFKHFEKMIEATENKIYGNNDYDTDDDTFGNEIFDEQTINEKMELMALYDNYFKERTKAKQSNISSNQSKVTKSLCSYLNNTQNSLADEVSKFAIKKDRFILSPESKALDSIEIIDKIPSYGTIISIDPTQQLSQREPDGTLKWRLNFNTKRKILSAKPAIVEKIRDYFSPRSYERKTLFYSAASVMYTYSIISEEIEHSLNSKK